MLIESASEILPLHAAADVLELSIESSLVFAVAPTVRIVAHSCSVCPLFCDEHPMCILPCLLKKLFEDPQLTITGCFFGIGALVFEKVLSCETRGPILRNRGPIQRNTVSLNRTAHE